MKADTKTILLVTAVFLFIVGSALPLQGQSQPFNKAIGVRLGTDVGITAKTTAGKGYIEGIVGSGYRALMLTILYERYVPAFKTEGFHWYFGAGGHVGFFNRVYGHYHKHGYDHYHNDGIYHYHYYYYHNEPTIGIAGIFGLEYKFREIPFAAAIDLKPFLNVYRLDYGMDGAFSFRYLF